MILFSQTYYADIEPSADRQFFCALLRGAPVLWPATQAAAAPQFLRDSHYHGIAALLYSQIKLSAQTNTCPKPIGEELKSAAVRAVAEEMIRRRAIEALLEALAARNVVPLLMKGTALAYSLYLTPELRSRSDTDLLIEKKDLQTAGEVFERLGYERPNVVTGELASSQVAYFKQDEYGVAHSFDLHWRISNCQIFAERLTFAELGPAATPIPTLAPHARGLGTVHALLLACMHRLSHRQAPYYVDGVAHYDSDRLIWLYDIHLLSQAFDGAQWDLFIQAARQKRLEEVCLDGLITTANCFGMAVPTAVLASLQGARHRQSLSVAQFGAPRWRWELLQIRALDGWGRRIRLVREQLFPSASYILGKYRSMHWGMLPFLYLHRAFSGFWKRL